MQAEPLVLHNNRGVSLLEIVFALGIMSIVGAALLTTSTVSMSMNMQNEIRDEAVNVAGVRMNQLRTFLFTDPALTATGGAIPDPIGGITSKIRNFTVTYNRTLTITDIGTNAKQITIVVSWPYKGRTFTHGITSLIKGTS